MMERDRRFYGKFVLKGTIKVETGLKIGAGRNVAEIGGVDSPVIRDPISGYPYIPGSSLKGRLRSLFEIYVHSHPEKFGLKSLEFNRNIGTQPNPIHIHVCETYEDAYKCPVCRLFGASGDKSNFPSRIIVRDAHLTKDWKSKPLELITEAKPEVSIDRITSKTNLRHFERVVAGAEFEFEIIYNVENTTHWRDDIKNILTAMALLEDSYLGGSGSRGYGKVKFIFDSFEFRPLDYYRTGKEEDIVSIDAREKSVRDILSGFDSLFSEVEDKLEAG
ncbi:type III-A CRISPR-associated RAMP protein Csm3 [Thermococcus sp. GR7]|uniref:type III-A CRISPR-associated RAMP protein Csm3 n=1 Tax=unclassified Thermococcus TaxID=2627626 RepID=UPI001431E0CE|nr:MULTISPECIES: type III-A CRISPR-associated RAMP protein Csm3 [unclassified Thermococcus]NJE47540.1 type III-A CRISPR-associated RAMP protein Csm3 [Thermococcus sp. GR7]NJE79527.1 type III-A CRISPR-associated RAMP protein Csm3 [Thermococcus sp. GR4]NJF22504.1 type III-A CRISPR-associated RAMP protein Csm3 [Thermococcus sp. GR5]